MDWASPLGWTLITVGQILLVTVGILLSLPGKLQADAADALAIALTHAHTRASLTRLGIPRTAWRRR